MAELMGEFIAFAFSWHIARRMVNDGGPASSRMAFLFSFFFLNFVILGHMYASSLLLA